MATIRNNSILPMTKPSLNPDEWQSLLRAALTITEPDDALQRAMNKIVRATAEGICHSPIEATATLGEITTQPIPTFSFHIPPCCPEDERQLALAKKYFQIPLEFIGEVKSNARPGSVITNNWDGPPRDIKDDILAMYQRNLEDAGIGNAIGRATVPAEVVAGEPQGAAHEAETQAEFFRRSVMRD